MQPTDISRLEDKIQKLQQKKVALSQQQDKTLLKKLKTLCGDHFSHQLILGLVSAALETAKPQQKEEWLLRGATFWQRDRKPKKTDD